MKPTCKVVRRLTASALAKFGDMFELKPSESVSVNQGRALRSEMAAGLSGLEGDARLKLAHFPMKAAVLRLQMALLEHQHLPAQIFMPMVCAACALVVAAGMGYGTLDIASARGFNARGGQGVVYRHHVLNHPIVALKAPEQFAMLIRESGEPDNRIEFHSPQPLPVTE